MELGYTSASLLALTLGPLAASCMALYWLERALDRQLEYLLGKRRIWITAWIGTPIHELSHAAMCLLFRHKIDDLRLFMPNHRLGTLGYVHHRYNAQSMYQRIGGFFIAIAPLFGGSAIIAALFLFMHPEPVAIIEEALMIRSPSGIVSADPIIVGKEALRLLTAAFDVSLIGQWRFWIFGYLAFAVGSHLAPSTADLKNAVDGGLVVLSSLLTLTVAILWAGVDPGTISATVTTWLSPILAILFFAITLNGAWLLLALSLTTLFRRL